MATQPGSTAQRGTSEEIQLRGRARRRLVGAIALVALIVVILPMVLDEQPNPVGQDIAINIPSPQAAEPASKIVPVNEAPVAAAEADGDAQPAGTAPVAANPVAAAAVPPTDTAKVAAVEPAKPQAAEAPAKSAKVVETPKTPGTDTAKAAKTADAPKAAKEQPAKVVADKPKEDKAHSGDKADKGGFVVQLGVYSSAANVKQMQAKLSGRGIRTYTETLKTESGSKIRLRAGPYASRQEAEKARDKLKAAGENGIVVANK